MDALPYPEQDPSELRARAVRERFEVVRLAVGHYVAAGDEYTRAAIRGDGASARVALDRSRIRLLQQVSKAEAFCLDAIERAEVRVIHFDRYTEGDCA